MTLTTPKRVVTDSTGIERRLEGRIDDPQRNDGCNGQIVDRAAADQDLGLSRTDTQQLAERARIRRRSGSAVQVVSACETTMKIEITDAVS